MSDIDQPAEGSIQAEGSLPAEGSQSQQAEGSLQAEGSINNAFRQYYDLTKPRVVMLIVFTAIVGMLLAVKGMPDLFLVLLGSIGIGLTASSGAAMNQIIDMRADAIMARTQDRPLATGGMSVWQAVVFGALLCFL